MKNFKDKFYDIQKLMTEPFKLLLPEKKTNNHELKQESFELRKKSKRSHLE